VIVVFVLLTTTGSLHKSAAEQATDADGGVVEEIPPSNANTGARARADPGVDSQVAAAIEAIDKGDYATGIDKLVELERAHPERAEIHRSLEKAYVATHASADAMNEADAWLKSDPAAVNDLKLAEDVRNTAVFGKEGSDHAFRLLEREMGANGIDVLYDIAWGQSGAAYPVAAARAQREIMRPDVRSQGNPGVKVTLDLRSASGCENKKAILDRAHDEGDARTVALLRTYTSTRGCGFAGARDCYGCIHRDGLLNTTIADIEARTRTQ
jgi:hypothetical protein